MPGYIGIANSALALIKRKGQQITLTRKGDGGTYDATAMTRVGGSDLTFALFGVPLPPRASSRFEPGQLLREDLIEVWFAARDAAETPRAGDRLTVNGGTREISSIEEYAPDGTAIAWRCYAKGV